VSIISRANSPPPSPFPLLAAIGAKTSRIEIGTAVIDMRYENPLYMAEDASAAALIGGGCLRHRSLIPGILVKPFMQPFPSVRLISPVGSWFSPRSALAAA
jgi:hypothetical protein